MKNIVLCFDGTWNKPKKSSKASQADTNVFKLFAALRGDATGKGANQEKRSGEASDQVKDQWAWYDPGVGSEDGEKVTGGITGFGLSENVQQGYEKLAAWYAPGDKVFLFGFSRGAFTARSLGGLIGKCGILKNADNRKALVQEAYALYRDANAKSDSEKAKAFRRKHSHDLGDQPEGLWCIGVWDTVGALGIPLADTFNKQFQFHSTGLSPIVKHGYHAIAVDEHRKNFDVCLWDTSKLANGQTVEQVWFPGAHADIGGGYPEDDLAQNALRWMLDKVEAAGLQLKPRAKSKWYPGGKMHDSYGDFFAGIYHWFVPKHFRNLGKPDPARPRLHTTTLERYHDPKHKYRPKHLHRYLGDGGT